ncbi:Rho-type gtpase-activating protein, partial [Coemansia sp. RSA 552]
HDSASDVEDAIITTVPQKATKRFLWPFGGGGGNSSGGGGAKTSGTSQHSFHVVNGFRSGKCDHCQERLKSFTTAVVRCRSCGFVSHQRCAGDVTASCAPADSGRSRALETAADGPMQSDAMFGRALAGQAKAESCRVPWVVRAAVAFIEREGLKMEGVYRRSGSTMDIREVHMQIARVGASTTGRFDNEMCEIAEASMDVTSVTSVLKQYLRDLPDPLMTTATYRLWVQAANVAEPERQNVYRTIADSMPPAHRDTLRFLMLHLQRVAAHQAHNKMTTNNLSVVFAPNILHMGKDDVLQDMANMSEINKTVSYLIQHADEIWQDEESPGAGQPNRPAVVLSSPSSPAHHHFSIDAGSHVDQLTTTLDSTTLSHSMPSPTNQLFDFQQHPSFQDSFRAAAPGKASFDISRTSK